MKKFFPFCFAESRDGYLLCDLHDRRGTLNVDKVELGRTMCPACDVKPRCVETGTAEELL